jgi:uncharacterized protein
MNAYLAHRNETANRLASEHSHHSVPVNWLNPYLAAGFEETRNAHVARAGNDLHWAFQKTKPWVNSLSPGCQLCGDGQWSCLFITGLCNAKCFYCPASQDKDETPQTQRLLFADPESYAQYVNHFKFSGVSFSGGEPLMVLDRTLRAIETIRRRCSPDVYIWMYTNGILGNEAKFRQLAAAGLDEIRFDLGATDYHLNVLRSAADCVRNVTVEIPAVPEEVERLKHLLPRLCELGVTRLNLHQLRLTAYNAEKLLQHEYTYLHGEQATVLESEIAAFELMAFVLAQGIPMGVNYCSFLFKSRFQKAGFRRKMATRLTDAGEVVTSNGFLRRIVATTAGVESDIGLQALASLPQRPDRIILYYKGRVLENLGDAHSQRGYQIEGRDYQIEDGLSAAPIHLQGEQIAEYLEMMVHHGEIIPSHPLLFQAWRQEFIESGLGEYF